MNRHNALTFLILSFFAAGAGPVDCGSKPVYFLRCSADGAAPYYAEVTDVDGLDAARVEPYKDKLIGDRTSGSGITCSITDEPPTLVGNPQ